MAKKEQYFHLAEQYYVESNMPISGIAKRLNVTEKTLHGWKKEGEWDNKRASFLRAQYSCNSALYELVGLLAKNMLESFKTQGTMPTSKEVYALTAMIDKLPGMKSFETGLADEAIAQTTEQKEKTFDNADIVKRIFDAMTQ